MSVDTFLLLGAALCFGLSAFNVNAKGVSLIPLGLFLWVLTALV